MKNCRFEGQYPASAAQIDIRADFHRGDSAIVIGMESTISQAAKSAVGSSASVKFWLMLT
jgi:hypothetical protein